MPYSHFSFRTFCRQRKSLGYIFHIQSTFCSFPLSYGSIAKIRHFSGRKKVEESWKKLKGAPLRIRLHERIIPFPYLFIASDTATATATEAPTIGLFPMPMSPIISTCAGTEEEPANCASECILPIVSVIP